MISSQQLFERLQKSNAEKFVLDSFTDSDNAAVFANLFCDSLKYVPERKSWYYYDGARWVHDIGGIQASLAAKMLADELYRYAGTFEEKAVKNRYLETAFKWFKKSVRDTIIDDARSDAAMSFSEFDTMKDYLNVKNGVYDLKKGCLLPHSPEYYFTKLAPVDYDDDVRNERFNNFIYEIMNGDSEMCLYLQKALGSALVGTNELECLFILFGATTRNGKSTLVETVISALGDYAASVNPESIAVKSTNSNAPNEDIARLNGIRFAAVNEPPASMVFNASKVKTLTGNDTVTARFLHENSFQFRPQFTIFINTNYLPSVNDMTLFKSGRLRVIPFERHFAPEEQDSTLKAYFQSGEAQKAVLNWLIDGYRLYSLQGMNPPDKVKNALSEYEATSDKIAQFVEECMEKADGAVTPTAQIYSVYKEWCEENGTHPRAKNKLSENLKLYGTLSREYFDGRRTRVFSGYRLSAGHNGTLNYN